MQRSGSMMGTRLDQERRRGLRQSSSPARLTSQVAGEGERPALGQLRLRHLAMTRPEGAQKRHGVSTPAHIAWAVPRVPRVSSRSLTLPSKKAAPTSAVLPVKSSDPCRRSESSVGGESTFLKLIRQGVSIHDRWCSSHGQSRTVAMTIIREQGRPEIPYKILARPGLASCGSWRRAHTVGVSLRPLL